MEPPTLILLARPCRPSDDCNLHSALSHISFSAHPSRGTICSLERFVEIHCRLLKTIAASSRFAGNYGTTPTTSPRLVGDYDTTPSTSPCLVGDYDTTLTTCPCFFGDYDTTLPTCPYLAGDYGTTPTTYPCSVGDYDTTSTTGFGLMDDLMILEHQHALVLRALIAPLEHHHALVF